MNLSDLLPKLTGVTQKPDDTWTAECPSCHSESLDISRAMPQPFVPLTVTCLADCAQGEVARALGMETDDLIVTLDEKAKKTEKPEKSAEPKYGADDVVTWILANYRLGRSTDGLLFALPLFPGSARIAQEVGSIRNDVMRRYRDAHMKNGKGPIVRGDTMKAALDTVAAYAETATEYPEQVWIRSAQLGDTLWLDLGDRTGRLVKVTAAGWDVVPPSDDTPLFRRSAATQPLPVPERGGDMKELRSLLGLSEDDSRWLLARGWLAGALFAEIPRPLLWATGPQGSGKSTRARMLLSLLEPTDELGKQPGKNERDDSTAARGRFLVSYDNIGSVSASVSDWLCRLVTGVTDDRRSLYTDDGLRPVSYRRSGVATSLYLPTGLGSDGLERLVVLAFDRVPDMDRRGEVDMWSLYNDARGKLLGALLDDVVTVLQNLPEVSQERRAWPRMADYGQVLLALDRGLGLPDDAGHFAAYFAGVNERLTERAYDDPFTASILKLMQIAAGNWSGTAEALRNRLDVLTDDQPVWWPTNARAVKIQLTKASEALRHAGITITHTKSNGAKVIVLSGMPVAEVDVPDDDSPLS